MLDCSDFLDGYSEYRDGLQPVDVAGLFENHVRECGSCARYHRIIGEGLQVLHSTPELQPSADFLPRLQHELYHVDAELRRAARGGSSAAIPSLIAVAASLVLFTWLTVDAPEPPVLELPAVAAVQPAPREELPRLFHSGPLLLSSPVPAVMVEGGTFRDRSQTPLLFYYSSAATSSPYPAYWVRP